MTSPSAVSLATPIALAATLAAYAAGARLQRLAGDSPLCNPVLVAVVLLAPALALTHVDYAVYFDGARPIHLLLGPATVALAVPLHRELARVRREDGVAGALISRPWAVRG